MKVSISQQVKFSGDNFPHSWSKEFDSVVIPHAGDYIEDPLWKDPYEYKVTKVIIDYYDNTCYVDVEAYNLEISSDRKDEFTEMAELHGWKAGWKI